MEASGVWPSNSNSAMRVLDCLRHFPAKLNSEKLAPIALVAVLSFSAVAAPAKRERVTLPVRVEELSDELKQPGAVLVGLPLPEGLAAPGGRLLVELDGKAIPAHVETASRWPDGSARVQFLRFRLDLTPRAKRLIEVTLNADRASPKGDGTIIATDPGIFAALEPKWYCSSGVFGSLLPSDENTFCPEIEPLILRKSLEFDGLLELEMMRNGYYDHAHAQYMVFLRSGSKVAYYDARRWARYYQKEHTQWLREYKRGTAIGWGRLRRIYAESLIEDYEISGDRGSLMVALSTADAVLGSIDANERNFRVNERNPAFPLIILTRVYALTGEKKYLDGAKRIVDIVCSWRDPRRGGWIRVYEDKDECPHGHRGGSPYMTAVLMEGLIAYHRLTNDRQVREAIIGGTSWLVNETWWPFQGHEDRLTFMYTQCRGAHDDRPGSGKIYDLNMMFMEMLGYSWYLTGNERYRAVAKQACKGGLAAFGAHSKAFNQAMRNLGRGFYYLCRERR